MAPSSPLRTQWYNSRNTQNAQKELLLTPVNSFVTTIQRKFLHNYCFSLQQISCVSLFFEQILRLELDPGDIVSTLCGAKPVHTGFYIYISKYISVRVLHFYCLAAALQLFPLVLDLLSGAGVSCAHCTLITAYNSHQNITDLLGLDRLAMGRQGAVNVLAPFSCFLFLASPVTFDFQMQKTTALHPKDAILASLPAH